MWPYHPKPKPDELLSSWLRRTAYGYAPKLHSFCNTVWPSLQIWNRDIDRTCPEVLFEGMSAGTGTNPALARATLLDRYCGTVFEGSAASSNPPWVLTLGVWHRKRRGFGQQFCTQCLDEDEEPYYRTQWRLGWYTACPAHGCRLDDRCDRCYEPCMPHRSRNAICHECGRDRRRHNITPAEPTALKLQVQLEGMITSGYFPPFGLHSTEPLSVFSLLRQIVKVISSGQRSARLRQMIAAHPRANSCHIDNDAPGFDRSLEFERLDVVTRHAAMALASHCLEGWPFMFVGFFGDAGVWRSWAAHDKPLAQLPFIYADAVDRYLSFT